MRVVYPNTPETTDASFFYNRHSFGSLQPNGTDVAMKATGKIHEQHLELFVVPEEIMNLLFVLPKAERWDGPMTDVADIMSRLSGMADKHSKKRDDWSLRVKPPFPQSDCANKCSELV